MDDSKRKTIIVIAWVIVIVTIAFLFSFKPPDRYIKWGDRKLQFSDFRFVEGPIFRDVAATTCTGIMMIWNTDSNTYHATAVFDKDKSLWSSKHIRNVPYLLNHEQRHFDITEYIVRKLNYDLKGKDSTRQLHLFKVYEEQLDLMQKLYDTETNHSVDSLRQETWNSIVNHLLSY